MIRWIAALILFAETYAVVRYGVFKGVSMTHWPLYLNNKALSLVGLALLGASFAVRGTNGETNTIAGGREASARLARAGLALVGLHVLMSLPLLGPGYFPQFFAGDKMNLTGELSLLLGVISFACFLGVAGLTLTAAPAGQYSVRRLLAQRLGFLALVTAAGHVLVMGIAGWLTPKSWPGGMPPITLLAFLAVLIPLLWRSRRSRRGRPRH